MRHGRRIGDDAPRDRAANRSRRLVLLAAIGDDHPTPRSTGYAARLRALVLRHAVADRLFRLTRMSQDARSARYAWRELSWALARV
jgi:hypothetical protein